MWEFDPEIIADFMKKVITFDGKKTSFKEGYIVVLTWKEYQRYKHNYYDSTETMWETFEENPFGYVIASDDHFIEEGSVVHFKPMIGFKCHMNAKYDIHVTLLHHDDWLIVIEDNE